MYADREVGDDPNPTRSRHHIVSTCVATPLGDNLSFLSKYIYIYLRDPNTLFRGNSLASKVIDEFMKLVGKCYLQRTLQACIDEVRMYVYVCVYVCMCIWYSTIFRVLVSGL